MQKDRRTGFPYQNETWDLVVMDIASYNRREKMMKLRVELHAVEEDRITGRSGCTLDELDAYLDVVIAEVSCMIENQKYMGIVSERAKRMLGIHIRFMAQAVLNHK